MTHILDNPIWNALLTGNKQFAYGDSRAKYINREVGLFAALKTNSELDLVHLHALIQVKNFVVLFTPKESRIPGGWRIELKKDILQMIYKKGVVEGKEPDVIPLQEKDIPAMLRLTQMTKPGPFLSRTIDFGNYEGIFQENSLVAMAGQRLQPCPYSEISAVCTHPDHTGKGYAAKLVRSQISKMTALSRIPFLHVNADNTAACRLYEKLGFEIRKQMLVYLLEKEV